MRILMVNKFLHPRGGSETYLLQLGRAMADLGHEVQYFGMDDPHRIVGNHADAYTANMDFHSGSPLKKLGYALRVIYSREARQKIRKVLDDFQPDICHLNNFHYQLTPSILLEIRSWERRTGHACKVIYTAHDYQLVCPNHLCRNPGAGRNCEKCLGGHYFHCIRGKCIHGSRLRSILGAAEAWFWNHTGVYRQIDAVICCSRFMKSKLDSSPVFREKTKVLSNFVEKNSPDYREKKGYVLYFGRYTEEKGVADLLRAAEELPDIPFFFAGSGPLSNEMRKLPNVTDLGFLSGEALESLIREARLTVCPSRWYENCPFSVMESISLGTPVLGADIGGIPELIQPGITGELFESGNAEDLKRKLSALWQEEEKLAALAQNCRKAGFDTAESYAEKLLKLI